MSQNTIVVVPWYREDLRNKFLEQWNLMGDEPFLHMQHDSKNEGCAITKNKGVLAAVDKGANIVVILDDDCYPTQYSNIQELIEHHLKALEPVEVPLMRLTTNPPSRGTPYFNRSIEMPVAASMGFWTKTPDYDACSQIVLGSKEPEFIKGSIHGQYFPLCGMNLAFRPNQWLPWCQFINVPRFDDIWMGWLWQKEAYRRGYCFNLNGPTVLHSRASNVWQNLRDESKYMEQNETLWKSIYSSGYSTYDNLRRLLPI